MTPTPTTVARLACAEETARQLASVLGESLDTDEAVCAAFEDENGRWQVAIHFRGRPNEAAVRALVALSAGEQAARALRFEELGDADWVAASLAGLSLVRAGRFAVHGAHDRARVPVNSIAVEIEAALAFGTGHHGSTRGCLLALDRLAKQRRVPRRILDLGTGSGVLAIAAAKCWRCPVVATDIDLRAVEAARGNVRRNHAAPYVMPLHAAGAGHYAIRERAPYDVILANILLGPLARLAAPFAKLSRRGTTLILSGLLPEHARALLPIYRAQGFALRQRITVEDWVTLVMTRGRGA